MRNRITCILFVAIAVIMCLPASVAHASPSETLTVVLILDNSGSMKNNDPQNLRFTGTQIMAGLLDPGDAFGLVLFSTQAQVLTDGLEIVGGTAVTGMSYLRELEASKVDGYTDVKAALQEASALLLSQPSSKNRKVVMVLLTDGKPEISNPYPGYEKETLEIAGALGIPIMAIALTQSSQTPFLDELVQVTNGTMVYAKDSSDLIRAFLQVLGKIKDRTVVEGIMSTSAGTVEIDPALAPYVDSATFIVAKTGTVSVQMLNPDGRQTTINGITTPHFILNTVETPVGGTYAFLPQGRGDMQLWAILRSRLRAQIISPTNVHPAGTDMLITVNLLEETSPGQFTKIIGEANFSALITTPNGDQVSLDRFYDDGTHGDGTANDGNHTRVFTDAHRSGVYQIEVRGWKRAVPVRAESNVQVLPFPGIVVDVPQGNVEVMGGAIELKVHLSGGNPSEFPLMNAIVVFPSGKVMKVEMMPGAYYTAAFMPAESGEYRVEFETRDARHLGVDYLANTQISFQVTVIPVVDVTVNRIDLPSSCSAKPEEVFVTLEVDASREGILRLSAPGEWKIVPEQIRINSGKQEIHLSLQAVGELRAGSHDLYLNVTGDDDLMILPERHLVLKMDVPGVMDRCRIPIRMGGGILVFAFAGVVVAARLRKAAQPLPVNGTLRHWKIGDAGMSVDIDLTAFHKNALMIGNESTCEIIISGSGLDPEHALISAKRTVAGVEMNLEPLGEVHKGYTIQMAPFVMKHGETFRMGSREFQYLSDHGE